MNETETTGKTPNRQGEYAKFVTLLPKSLQKLDELLESRNEAIRLGAINTIVDRVVPKLKALELHGGLNLDGTKQPIQLLINSGSGFVPATIQFNAPSATGHTGESTTIQSTGVASESKKDDNSDTRDSQTGSS